MPVGRPKKYQYPRTSFVLNLPIDTYNVISKMANEKDISRTELINSIITDYLQKNKAGVIAESLSQINRQIKKLREENKRLTERFISSVQNAVQSIMEIKADNKIVEYFDKHKQEIPNIGIEKVPVWTKILFEKIEVDALKDGYTIKNKKMVQEQIKMLLLRWLDKKLKK